MKKQNNFPCDKCGLCCRNLDKSEIYSDLHDGDGICRYLDLETNLCRIYENRPLKCNIIKSYELFFTKYDLEKYIELNMLACKKLKGGI